MNEDPPFNTVRASAPKPAAFDPPVAETALPRLGAGATVAQSLSEQLGSAQRSLGEPRLPNLAGYEIIEELGRGGMGIVYKARQTSVNRIVALKMIISGEYASPQDLVRFQTEAEAVAGLQHSHVVQLHEFGNHEGLPYFTLEYIEGGSLAKKAAGGPLPAMAAAKLVEQIAGGVAAAHARGIIHRDLKPENVLLTVDGTPKITDFGLAKRHEVENTPPSAARRGEPSLTSTGAIMGTPSYMAPEQARSDKSIGPAADVYALGAILYRLVTGRPPFLGATSLDTVMQVIDTQPVAPRNLIPSLPRDLETICLKCLRKEPERRYASAAALVDDLRRFQEGHPILARPVGSIERGWRWCRRNPAVAASLFAAALVLVLGTVVASFFAFEADKQARESRISAAAAKKNAAEALEAKSRVDRALHAARMYLAQNALRENRLIRLRELLDETEEQHRGWEWHFTYRQGARHMPETRLIGAPEQLEHPGCLEIACPEERARVAVLVPRGDSRHEVECRVYEAKTGAVLLAKQFPRRRIDAVACRLSEDGQSVAVIAGGRLTVCDVDSRRERLTLMLPPISTAFAIDPKGGIVAFNDGSAIKAIRIDSGKVEATIADAGVGSQVQQIEFSGDGQRLCASRSEFQPGLGSNLYLYRIVIYDMKTGKTKQLTEPSPLGDASLHFALSSDDKWLAIASGKRTVAIWDTVHFREVPSAIGVSDRYVVLALSNDRRFVAVGGSNGLIAIHDRYDESATPLLLRGHESSVWALRFAGPDRLLSVSADGKLRQWDLSRVEPRRFPGWASTGTASVFEPAFNVSGTAMAQIVTLAGSLPGTNRRELQVWDTEAGRARLRHDLRLVPAGSQTASLPRGKIALSSDGKYVAFVLFPQEDLDAIRAVVGLVPGIVFRTGAVNGAKVAIDAGLRALMPKTNLVQVVDVDTRKLISSFPLGVKSVTEMSFSPDGKSLLIDGDQWSIHAMASGAQVAEGKIDEGQSVRAVYSPDGQRIGLARSWKMRRGEYALDAGPVPSKRDRASIEIGTAGAARATTSIPLSDKEARLHIARVRFSPSGKLLAAVGVGPDPVRGAGVKLELPMRLLVWRCEVGGGITQLLSVPFGAMLPMWWKEPMAFGFNADETAIAAGARTGPDAAELRVWELESGIESHAFRVQANGVELVAFTPDGQRLLAATGTVFGAESGTAEANVWDLISGQELAEIPLGRVLSSTGTTTSAYHFDGYKLRGAGWNDNGGELRTLDGSPIQ
jgi:serine/threonine protein kinase/WD40 repeat protein